MNSPGRTRRRAAAVRMVTSPASCARAVASQAAVSPRAAGQFNSAHRSGRSEPVRQLRTGIAVQHINIQFALMGETGQGEITAAQITDDRVHRVLPVQQIQLGVQQVAKIDLHHELVSAKLGRELAERAFVLVGRVRRKSVAPGTPRQYAAFRGLRSGYREYRRHRWPAESGVIPR